MLFNSNYRVILSGLDIALIEARAEFVTRYRLEHDLTAPSSLSEPTSAMAPISGLVDAPPLPSPDATDSQPTRGSGLASASSLLSKRDQPTPAQWPILTGECPGISRLYMNFILLSFVCELENNFPRRLGVLRRKDLGGQCFAPHKSGEISTANHGHNCEATFGCTIGHYVRTVACVCIW
jgi:hypothetical protein